MTHTVTAADTNTNTTTTTATTTVPNEFQFPSSHRRRRRRQDQEATAPPRDKNQQKKECDRKRKQLMRNLGMTFTEESVVIENGMIQSINDMPITSISLETLRAFCRKIGLKMKALIPKIELQEELANFIILSRSNKGEKVVIQNKVGTSTTTTTDAATKTVAAAPTHTTITVAAAINAAADSGLATHTTLQTGCSKKNGVVASRNNIPNPSTHKKVKNNHDCLLTLKLDMERSKIDKNISFKKLLDHMYVSQRRIRHVQLLDCIMETEERLGEIKEQQEKEVGMNGRHDENNKNDRACRKIQLLQKKLDVLKEEEEEISSFFHGLLE